jgi:acetoin utilization deacetylase AcuC-like enzyme
MLKIAWSPVYQYELPKGHRFPMEKYQLIPEQLLYEGTIQQEQLFHPGKLDEETILLTHTAAYWNKLQTLSLSRKEIRDIGFPVTKELVERGRYIAQGTINCARYAIQYGISLNLAGGTHHAYAHRGEGFCVYNDFAIASNYLLKERAVSKILIVDLDVHQGNGNAHIFQDEPRVFTFSIHGERNFPLRKEKSDLDIGLPDGTTDATYLRTLQETLPRLIQQENPDLIFYLAGVDVLEVDKLGRLSLTVEGCKERDRIVFTLAHQFHIPIAVSMGGGYSDHIKTLIDAHANTFRIAKSIFDG